MVSELFSVKDKVILVTGGGAGVGYGITRGLVKNGAIVYICSRDEKKCKDAAVELNKMGPGKCIALKADLSKVEECKGLIEEIRKEQDHMDVLINNSGCNWGEPLETYPDSAWDKVLALNVKAVFNTSVAALPLLKKRSTKEDPARIINIGSIDGIRVPQLETYAYSASKSAVHQLTRTLASRLAPEHILVNCIALGPYLSKMTKQTFTDFEDIVLSGVATGRFCNDDDLEGTLIFLSSKASGYITGAILPLDGGCLIKSNL